MQGRLFVSVTLPDRVCHKDSLILIDPSWTGIHYTVSIHLNPLYYLKLTQKYFSDPLPSPTHFQHGGILDMIWDGSQWCLSDGLCLGFTSWPELSCCHAVSVILIDLFSWQMRWISPAECHQWGPPGSGSSPRIIKYYRANQKTGLRYRGLNWQQTNNDNWLANLTDCFDLNGWNLYWHWARITSTLFSDSPCSIL